MENKRFELIVFSALFIGLLLLTFFVFQPFLSIIILATVLAVLFHPLNVKMVKLFHGGKSLVACLLVAVAFIFLVIPILFFSFQILGQAQSFFSLTQASQGQYMQVLQQNINTLVQYVIPTFSFSISDSAKIVVDFFSNNLGVLLSQTVYIFFQIFLMLFAFFFFLRDGEELLDSFVSLSPFEEKHNKEITDSVYRTITSVVRGTLFVGLIRFLLFVGIFYLLNIPNALLWASLSGIVGMVPGFGSPLATVPAFLYLLLSGNIFGAVCMGLFGILLVIFIDNMLSTYFFGKGLDILPIFVLFSIIGGVIFFGPLGFIFGPIILSLFVSAIDMYRILLPKKT